MIAAGLDIGSLFAKAVIMRGDDVVASAMVRTSGDVAGQARALIQELAAKALPTGSHIECLGVTGANAEMIPEADFKEDTLACVGAAAAFYLSPVQHLIDMGGQSITSLALNPDGEVVHFQRNDKCAAGSGRLLEVMSAKLKLDLSDIDTATAGAGEPVQISSQCGVFAESEVITHVNNGESVGAVMAGVCSSVARMAVAQGKRSGVAGRFTLTGGVARIDTITAMVQRELGGDFCPFPVDPQLATAIGAALLGDPE